MIKTGDQLPDVTLYQYNSDAGACAIGPMAFSIRERCKHKKVLIFALPGAFTRRALNVTFPVMSRRPLRFVRLALTKSCASR